MNQSSAPFYATHRLIHEFSMPHSPFGCQECTVISQFWAITESIVYVAHFSFMIRVMPPMPLFGPLIVIEPEPDRGKPLCLLQRFKEILTQSIVTHCPAVAFGISVLLRFSGLDVPGLDSFSRGTGLKNAAHVFQTVIATNLSGTAAPFDNVFQGVDYPFRGLCEKSLKIKWSRFFRCFQRTESLANMEDFSNAF